MRVLIVGAGAIGGYFGGRMLQAGRDITFLVRPRRASELAAAGLVIKSPNGDVTLTDPPVVQADTIKDKFDVVLLSCKAYDLDDAIKSFAPAVGERTAIIPLLNGMRHLDVLDKKIGASHVLGGLCLTAMTLSAKWSSWARCSRLASASETAKCRTAFAPSRTSSEAAISTARRARPSCRTCGRNGFSSHRARPRPA